MKKFGRFALAALLAGLIGSQATAQTVFVDEDFESYADLSALNAVWPNTNTPNGRLVDETFTEFLTLDDVEPQDVGARAFPEEGGGQGFEHGPTFPDGNAGYVEIDVAALNGGEPLFPTEELSIVLEGDIFDVGALGNKRRSIGLRNSAGQNLIELGFWNAEIPDGSGNPVIGYAYRGVLFPPPSVDPNPDWGYFELPSELDRPDDLDEVVTVADIGEDWHRYRAVITPDTITYEIDLGRNGLNDGTGAPGVDASVTLDLVTGGSGYDSLRLGGPSGVSSAGSGEYGGVIFDNIYLALEDADMGGGLAADFNGDGTVDLLDLDILGQNFGGTGGMADGDANGDGNIDLLDLDILGGEFGMSAGSAVPEPGAFVLVAGALGLLAGRRR